jgi:GAF domain-containing protein
VLRVISSSPGELQPVFEAMLQNAVRICDAKFGNLGLLEGDGFRLVAQHGAPPKYRDARQREPFVRAKSQNLERAIKTKEVVHVVDVAVEQPDSAIATLAGARTLVNVPMLKDTKLVGIIAIYRQEVRPFTDKQIELLQNFAAQAVIAIENARLLSELRESLEQQTATSDVLKVISSSPGDLEPVFSAVLESAARLCHASFGNIFRWQDDGLHLVATYNTPAAFIEARSRAPLRRDQNNPIGQMLAAKTVLHVHDLAADARYANRRDPNVIAAVELGGVRTFLAVPMLKDNELIGALIVYRQEVRPFSDKQIELVKSFAAQAVIAVENARLLSELRESLDQQTATSEVLKVISSSPGELNPVFRTMLENAVRICEAKFGDLFVREGEGFRNVAHQGPQTRHRELWQQEPFLDLRDAHPGLPLSRVAATKQIFQVADAIEAGYRDRDPRFFALVESAGARTVLGVPMLRNDELIGAIIIYRQEVRPFSDKQIELVKSFAAQAVIAIENARLLNELRERTDEVVKLNQQLEQRVTDQVGEIERMGRLRRFLPPQVADLIVASGTDKQLESHRREITALFCDLRGFTGFSESSDPEDVMTLLRQYHAAIGEIIIKYSGTLERYAGDGVMVVFNDPVPVDNPALQAVRMALDMRAALSTLIEKWRRLGHELGFGIGIAHGYATLGTIGFEGRFDYAAIGTVSNVASRLCDEAKPGQILIAPRVLMAIEEAVAVEAIGDFALKGISRPLAAYNVVGMK